MIASVGTSCFGPWSCVSFWNPCVTQVRCRWRDLHPNSIRRYTLFLDRLTASFSLMVSESRRLVSWFVLVLVLAFPHDMSIVVRALHVEVLGSSKTWRLYPLVHLVLGSGSDILILVHPWSDWNLCVIPVVEMSVRLPYRWDGSSMKIVSAGTSVRLFLFRLAV